MRPLARVAVASAIVTGVLVSACGDDDVVTSPKVDAGAEATAPPPPPPRDDGAVVQPPDAATCGSSTCAPAIYGGVVAVPACCAPGGGCGLDLRPLAGLYAVSTTCSLRAAPGSPSADCPAWPVRTDEAGAGTVLQGCCRPDHTCGALVDLGSGIDMGCQAAADFVLDAGPAPSCDLDAGTD